MTYHNCVSVILGLSYSLAETIKKINTEIPRLPHHQDCHCACVKFALESNENFEWMSKEACRVGHITSKLYLEEKTSYYSRELLEQSNSSATRLRHSTSPDPELWWEECRLSKACSPPYGDFPVTAESEYNQ